MSTPHASARLAPLLLALLTAGCAAGAAETRPARWTGATLEVVNRTGEAMIVGVRGDDEGTVQPGSRARFRWLTPGEAAVTARPRYAEPRAGGPPIQEAVTLVEGETVRWLLPGPRPLPPPLSTLEVENTLRDHVEVYLGDRRLGRVLAGDGRVFRDLPSGDHAVAAVQPETGLRLTEQVTLPEDRRLLWTVETDLGTLTVVNDGDEPVQLYLDGRPRDRLRPGERAVLEHVVEGPHELVAQGLQTELERHHRLTLDADVPYEWRLELDRAAVTLVNATGEPLELTLPASAEAGSGVVLELPPGEEHTLEDRPAGEMILRARGLTTDLPYDDRIRLVAGRHLEWAIHPPRVAVRIENHTARPLVITAEGYRRGRVRPGSHLLVGNLPARPVEVTAAAEDGSTIHSRVVEPGLDRAAVWRVEAAVSAVEIANERPDTVTVFADSRRLGTVPPTSSVVLTGVEVGTRLLEAVDERGRRIARARLPVREGEVLEWLLADPRGTLVITNRTGEPLQVQGRLAGQQARIAPDQRVLYHVEAGRIRVRAVGGETALAYTHAVEVQHAGVVEWEILPARGGLEVINALEEAVHLELDDQPLGRVAAGGRKVLDDVPPGPHRLRAEGVVSQRVRTVKRLIPPDDVARWRIVERPARALVINQTVEPLSVFVDERPYGRVEAHSRKGFAQLPTGHRTLDAIGLTTGWTYTVDLELRDGATSVVRVPSPTAVLLVDNQSGEAQRIEVDGETLAEVPEGALEHAVPVPAGKRRVLFEGVASGRVWTVGLALRPSQTVPLTVPPPTARLVIVNRAGRALQVHLDDRALGLLAADESLVLEDLEPDTYRLEARDPDGGVTHRERRTIRRGRTDTWVLPAPAE